MVATYQVARRGADGNSSEHRCGPSQNSAATTEMWRILTGTTVRLWVMVIIFDVSCFFLSFILGWIATIHTSINPTGFVWVWIELLLVAPKNTCWKRAVFCRSVLFSGDLQGGWSRLREDATASQGLASFIDLKSSSWISIMPRNCITLSTYYIINYILYIYSIYIALEFEKSPCHSKKLETILSATIRSRSRIFWSHRTPTFKWERSQLLGVGAVLSIFSCKRSWRTWLSDLWLQWLMALTFFCC